jgi:hypothetical protein
VSGLGAALKKSTSDAFSGENVTDSTAFGDNFTSSSRRLSLLGYVHDLVSLPNTAILEGNERVYAAPFYPFIPRAIWKNKPVLDKGHRFSAALGIPITSSTTLTLPGDMFVLGGLAGVAFGMFVYGIATQVFMNCLGERLSEKAVFFFVAMLAVVTNLELDVTMMVAGTVQKAIIILAIAFWVYGGRFFSLHTLPTAAPESA